MGESYFRQSKFRNLRYSTKYICHVILVLLNSDSAHPITPVYSFKLRFWDNSKICLLFSRKQQQRFTTSCWQYHIRNQHTRSPQYTCWSYVTCTILKFVYTFVINNNKYLPHDVDNIIFLSAYPITPVEQLKPRYLHNSEICLLFSRNKYLSHVVDNIIFGINVPN